MTDPAQPEGRPERVEVPRCRYVCGLSERVHDDARTNHPFTPPAQPPAVTRPGTARRKRILLAILGFVEPSGLGTGSVDYSVPGGIHADTPEDAQALMDRIEDAIEAEARRDSAGLLPLRYVVDEEHLEDYADEVQTAYRLAVRLSGSEGDGE